MGAGRPKKAATVPEEQQPQPVESDLEQRLTRCRVYSQALLKELKDAANGPQSTVALRAAINRALAIKP